MGDFKITGPGRYRMRNGKGTTVYEVFGGASAPWRGEMGYYEDDGTFNLRDLKQYDIVAGPLDDKPQKMSGLSGFITLSPDGRAWAGLAIDVASARVGDPHIVIDLSKVPTSAIVRPEPKRETRKVWLSFEKNGSIYSYSAKPPASVSEDSLALVEREIDFTHGEGLGNVS